MWRRDPPDDTSVCGGFDGSKNDDWTAIKLETRAGYLFTPRYGPDARPTIWNPREWGGSIPRAQVRVAWSELTKRFDVRRVYCDPGFHDEESWETDIELWQTDLDEAVADYRIDREQRDVFVQWPTNQANRMYPALRRFEADLRGRVISHDGCPITEAHMRNTRKIPVRGDRYILGKPSQHQKIDAAVTSVVTHEAAADERAAGWEDVVDSRMFALG